TTKIAWEFGINGKVWQTSATETWLAPFSNRRCQAGNHNPRLWHDSANRATGEIFKTLLNIRQEAL
ncbi:MAG: hypothetical protein AAB658_14390, partial [Chloroflexota bacterium]